MNNVMKAYLSIAAIGIADAIYHAYESITVYHASWCDINALYSCGGALASRYSHLSGIPLYAFGLLWFPLTLIAGLWYQRSYSTLNTTSVALFLMIGNIFTIYLWYVDLALIHIICLVCVSLYVINYALTAVCLFGWLKKGQNRDAF
jgi:uncharacterized membrane protein